MRLATLILFVLLTGMPWTSQAQNCANAETQMAMNACAASDFHAADARLNATYNEVMTRVRGLDDARKLLVTSELAWVRFRDAECAFATNQVSGGSIRPMIQSSCETDLTKQRTRQLRAYLDCREGDLSCPLPPDAAPKK